MIKITESQLRKIISEELESQVVEAKKDPAIVSSEDSASSLTDQQKKVNFKGDLETSHIGSTNHNIT